MIVSQDLSDARPAHNEVPLISMRHQTLLLGLIHPTDKAHAVRLFVMDLDPACRFLELDQSAATKALRVRRVRPRRSCTLCVRIIAVFIIVPPMLPWLPWLALIGCHDWLRCTLARLSSETARRLQGPYKKQQNQIQRDDSIAIADNLLEYSIFAIVDTLLVKYLDVLMQGNSLCACMLCSVSIVEVVVIPLHSHSRSSR